MENTVSCNAKNETFARIFDMAMHTIISGDTNDQICKRDTSKDEREGRKREREGEERQTEQRSTMIT